MLYYFNIALLTLHFINVLLFIVALVHVALFNVALLMLHYFNASLFAVALFNVALFIAAVALFTVAQYNVAQCKYCTMLCSTILFLYHLILHYINISLFDSEFF